MSILCTYHLAYLCSASVKSDENQAVITILVKEVIGLNPTFEAHDIQGKDF